MAFPSTAAANAIGQGANVVAKTGLPSRVIDNLIAAGLLEIGGGLVSSATGGLASVAPKSPPLGTPTPTTGRGAGFFRSAADYADYVRQYQQEAYNRALAGMIPGVGESFVEKLPPLLSPEEFFDLQYTQAESAAEGLAQRERALEALKGELGIEKVKAEKLGDIEREKVARQYGLAQGVLESTISTILAKPDLTGSAVLTEVARAV